MSATVTRLRGGTQEAAEGLPIADPRGGEPTGWRRPWLSPYVVEVATTYEQARRMVRRARRLVLTTWDAAAIGDRKVTAVLDMPKATVLRELDRSERLGWPLMRLRSHILDRGVVWIET